MMEGIVSVLSNRKPFYRLDDMCRRWGVTNADIEAFVFAGELTLAAQVTSLRVERGYVELAEDGSPCRLPEEVERVTGVLDLRAEDASYILRNGYHQVFSFAAKPGHYLEIRSEVTPFATTTLTQSDLVVRRQELQRFEAAHQMTRPVIDELPARQRGAQPTHDWDAFWIETCRLLFFDGVPASQAALIRHLQAWFAAQGRKVPDESTLKRKLKPIWDMVAPEARRAAS
jgi:hypothetical protein